LDGFVAVLRSLDRSLKLLSTRAPLHVAASVGGAAPQKTAGLENCILFSPKTKLNIQKWLPLSHQPWWTTAPCIVMAL
jgi:hypothetical protein